VSDQPVALSSAGLHLYYGDTHALKGITLELPERQISALIGRPGAASRPSCAASTG